MLKIIILILTIINSILLVFTILNQEELKRMKKKKSYITPKLSDLHGKELSDYVDNIIDK